MNAIYDSLDGGSLELRSGAQEANPEAAAQGTLLATLALSVPAFAPAAGSAGATITKSLNPISNAIAANSGTAAHFRFLTPGGVCVFIGDVAAAGSDLNIPVVIAAGQTVSVGSGRLQMAY